METAASRGRFWDFQKECDNLEILKNVAGFDEEEGHFNFGRKRTRNEEYARQNIEIEERNRKGEFEGLIIDRSKYQQEIGTQIDQLGSEFQKAERHGGGGGFLSREANGVDILRDYVRCCRRVKSWAVPIPE